MSKPLLFSDVYEALAALSSTGHAYGDDGCFRVFYDGASASCCLEVHTALSTFPTRDMHEVPVCSLCVDFVSFADQGSVLTYLALWFSRLLRGCLWFLRLRLCYKTFVRLVAEVFLTVWLL